jgi:hypothetical protein
MKLILDMVYSRLKRNLQAAFRPKSGGTSKTLLVSFVVTLHWFRVVRDEELASKADMTVATQKQPLGI